MDTQNTKPDVSSAGDTLPDAGSTLNAETVTVTAQSLPAMPDEATDEAHGTPFRQAMRQLFRRKRAVASIIVIALFILVPIVGPPIYQHIGGTYNSMLNGKIGPTTYHSPYFQELDQQNEGPSAQYWLGTDSIGRDMFALLMEGMLISLCVAVLVEIVNITLGLTIGILSGYFGGWIDQFLARFTDVMFAFPGLLFAILLTGIFGIQADSWFSHVPVIGANGDARLVLVSIALAMVGWPTMARLARGQTLLIKEQQYIEAARTIGTTNLRIVLRHVLPNLINIIIVAATLDISGTIIGEAGLSFLGLGVQSPGTSIGLMIADNIKQIQTHPWQVILPTLTLTIIVLAFSFLGDALRDVLDPRMVDK
jgi:oligopeptide transport system permease protein